MRKVSRCCAVLLLASLGWAQQPEATGTVDGNVVNALTGEPVNKAEVTLAGPPPQSAATTDASGHFVFRGLAAGSYWLNPQRPGYTTEDPPRQMTLAAGERKSGVEIRLVPLGTISGRVVDEYGLPVPNCFVQVMLRAFERGRNRLTPRGGEQTNDKGDYRIHSLPRGRYYVDLRCWGELVAPHPLMPADDPRTPKLVIAPQFYPGVPDVNGAAQVAVAAGANARGIDFVARRINAVTVRGRILNAGENVQVILLSDQPGARDWIQFSAGVDRSKGTFQISGVPPGSYLLVASTMGAGPVYQARMPLQVGSTPPDPVNLALDPVPDLTGVVEVEGENPPPLENFRVSLTPIDVPLSWQQPDAAIDRDGRFTLPAVAPGRWQLSAAQGQGYVKSFQIGEKDASPYGFDLLPGETGPLKIVVSMKTAQVKVTVAGASADGFALLVPADPERLHATQVVGTHQAGCVFSNVAPGRYRVFAVATAQTAWDLQQRPDLVKPLEPRAQTVDLEEGQTAEVTVDLIPAADLQP